MSGFKADYSVSETYILLAFQIYERKFTKLQHEASMDFYIQKERKDEL